MNSHSLHALVAKATPMPFKKYKSKVLTICNHKKNPEIRLEYMGDAQPRGVKNLYGL
jgi:hypothetical protein